MTKNYTVRPYRLPVSPFVSPAKAIADVAAGQMAQILSKRGFVDAGLMAHWAEIVGAELAAVSLPERIVWPRRAQAGAQDEAGPAGAATLYLRVAGPLAIEVQHRQGEIMERINRLFGFAAVGQIRIVQAPLPRKPERSEPSGPDRPAAAGPSRNLASALARLRAALARR